MIKQVSKLILATLFFVIPLVTKAAGPLDVYFFYMNGCPHCAREEVFLDNLANDYGQIIDIHRYEVSENSDNVRLFMEFGERLQVGIQSVPFTVVGEEYFIGYLNDATSGEPIKAAIDDELAKGIYSVPALKPPVEPKQIDNPVDILNTNEVLPDNNQNEAAPSKQIDNQESQDNISLPILGEINPHSFSLPLITIVLGLLDGFNPCAMWALLFLISLLLGMHDKKRMWTLGSIFIVASALVYFLFMAAWLNLILFLGLVLWVRIVIGMIALGGGTLNIREYFKKRESGCKVTDDQNRRRIFDKLKMFTQQKKFVLAILGIIILAFAVNLIELVCSAGLPAVYTQILALNDLPHYQYYLYILLYIFFFMLDDLAIFFIAMITLQVTGISTKYSKWSSLLGGVLMLIIGFLLIFKHEWLMFG